MKKITTLFPWIQSKSETNSTKTLIISHHPLPFDPAVRDSGSLEAQRTQRRDLSLYKVAWSPDKQGPQFINTLGHMEKLNEKNKQAYCFSFTSPYTSMRPSSSSFILSAVFWTLPAIASSAEADRCRSRKSHCPSGNVAYVVPTSNSFRQIERAYHLMGWQKYTSMSRKAGLRILIWRHLAPNQKW